MPFPDMNKPWNFSELGQDWVCETSFYFDHCFTFCKPYSELEKAALEPDYLIPYYIKHLKQHANLYAELKDNHKFLRVLTAYMRMKSLEEKVMATFRYLYKNQIALSELEKCENQIMSILPELTSKLNLLVYHSVKNPSMDLTPWMEVCTYMHDELEKETPLYLNIRAAPKRLQKWLQILS